MTRSTIDFSLAPRRKQPEQGDMLKDMSSGDGSNAAAVDPPRSAEAKTLLPRLPEEERLRNSARRAAEQQETRRRLKNLKRTKERNIRFYVNVPLEQDVKARLLRAAHENDIRMTVIMQAAIDTYLQDNGY
ncbi:hypothetical protein [Rhizobium sp. BK060]|uniref:hypothetical protein n=1 Tax=Rhizobium sp. BK060 TaxID=2587096 RepID=UPI0016202E9F|nr:hypothetical protein [Rhizobium sp. BK060]MBB3397885.1 hypothetical protein [Rhizobium sp. BK060]